MSWYTVASIVAGFAVARLADALVGIEELAGEVAQLVHSVTGRPRWLA